MEGLSSNLPNSETRCSSLGCRHLLRPRLICDFCKIFLLIWIKIMAYHGLRAIRTKLYTIISTNYQLTNRPTCTILLPSSFNFRSMFGNVFSSTSPSPSPPLKPSARFFFRPFDQIHFLCIQHLHITRHKGKSTCPYSKL